MYAPWRARRSGSASQQPASGGGGSTGAFATSQSPYSGQQGSQPSQAPNMSAYSPRAADTGSRPQGARANDLSGNVPSNQLWGQAYNQASNQFGGNTQAQSWTMPGAYTSQGYNPTTGQYGKPSGGESWDGNMAYNAIDQRPGPIQASATGVGGNPMQWQDAMTQREAFVGNLSDRLNQYSSGQRTGQPTFNPSQLIKQANDQLSNGTFYNPFGQQNPDVQQAMGGASQYASGSQWQNPFGNSPQANTPMPSWAQAPAASPPAQPAANTQPGAAQPKQTQSIGTAYEPSPTSLPEPPPARTAPPVRYGWRARANPVALPEEEAPPETPAPPTKKSTPVRAPQNMVIVPTNRRGSSARYGGLRQNGDNRR